MSPPPKSPEWQYRRYLTPCRGGQAIACTNQAPNWPAAGPDTGTLRGCGALGLALREQIRARPDHIGSVHPDNAATDLGSMVARGRWVKARKPRRETHPLALSHTAFSG